MMPAAAKTARPRRWPLREIMNAIYYVMRVGIGWRLLAPKQSSATDATNGSIAPDADISATI